MPILATLLLWGNIQFDLSYATIPIFGGKPYRKCKMTYVISDPEKLTNFPSCTTDNIINFMLSHDPQLIIIVYL